jgi:uncharacterized membrane-anchored protein YhcB (DUF1043 family)
VDICWTPFLLFCLNEGIDEIKKIIEEHSAEIRRHEDNKTELKDRITAAYKDLRSFDPVI